MIAINAVTFYKNFNQEIHLTIYAKIAIIALVNNKKIITHVIFFGVLLFFGFLIVPVNALTYINNTPQDLSPSTNWHTFFQTHNGGSSSTTHFGSYVFLPKGDDLFIGLANYRPADAGGATIAKFDGTNVSFVGNLDEEGVNEMIENAGKVIIGGVDPHDSWALGNVYSYDGSILSKYRSGNGLTNVIHMWAIHRDNDGTLYAATSSHDGSFPATCVNGVSCFGTVFKSTNNGQNWSQVAVLGQYRVFDIIRFDGDLYALYVDSVAGDNVLAKSSNNGQTWEVLKSDGGLRRTHMVEFDGYLYMLGGGSNSNALYRLDKNDVITQINPPFEIGVRYADASRFSNYNQFVVASDGYMYTISVSGDIWRTHTGNDWHQVNDTNLDVVAINFWPNKNYLVYSSSGASMDVFYLDLSQNRKTKISNLSANLSAIDQKTGLNTATEDARLTSTGRSVRLYRNNNIVLANTVVDLSENRDWSMVSADSDLQNSKSIINGFDPAPGSAISFEFFTPVDQNKDRNKLTICPDAVNIGQVKANCVNKIDFALGESKSVNGQTVTVTQETISGRAYWKMSNFKKGGAIDTSTKVRRSSNNPQLRSSAQFSSNEGSVKKIAKFQINTLANSVDSDYNVVINEIKVDSPFLIKNKWWSLSSIYEAWYENHEFQNMIFAQKDAIISYFYENEMLTNDGTNFFLPKNLRIASSLDNGKTWIVNTSSVLDQNSKNISAISSVRGWYMLVGSIQ